MLGMLGERSECVYLAQFGEFGRIWILKIIWGQFYALGVVLNVFLSKIVGELVIPVDASLHRVTIFFEDGRDSLGIKANDRDIESPATQIVDKHGQVFRLLAKAI